MITKFKKTIALLLAVTMAMLLNFPNGIFGNIGFGLTAKAAEPTLTAPTVGNGSAESPYQIGTAAELYWFADKVKNDNSNFGGANAVLTADITVNSNLLGSLKYDTIGDVTNGNSFTAWTPIGYFDYSNARPYTGTFDGQGHTISGLYFKKTQENYVGLFGYVGNGGHVLNVGVVDSYVRGGQYVGGVCGYNYHGIIENCYNKGTVRGSNTVGGVCGYNYDGKIKSCYNTGSVSGSNPVGGVCGYKEYGEITNCYYLESTASTGIGLDSTSNGKAESKNTTLFTDGTICQLVEYHSHQNGICILCGNYKPATKTTDKYDINGDDTKDEVYEISNAGQLYWFAKLVNDGTTNANAVLTADITVNKDVLKSDGTLTDAVSGFKSWTPIGYYKSSSNFKSYTGTFDGQRHTISGLYFNDTDTDYVGLFGYVGNGGRVLNVGVVDSYFSGSNLVGGVCGYNKYGTIENCYNEGTVSGSSNSSGSNNSNYVGGVCGDNDNGTIENCYNKGTVSGNTTTGGVCGYNKGSGKITNCYNKGKVSGGAASKVGGVCGWNYGTIENCYSAGAVSGDNKYVGGVCGDNGGTIEKCYNTGSVSGVESVGGVCGHNKGKITNCYNEGTVSGSSNYVGGVCGHNEGGTIENCYNTVSISNSSYYVGGVCGYNEGGTITNCYYDSDKCKVGGIKSADTVGQAEGKTPQQFASGEVCYLLNGDQSTLLWGQTIGKESGNDAYPVFYKNNTVYCGYADCNAADKTYSNSALHETKGHKYDGVNHACSYCGNAFAAIEVNYAKLESALTNIYNVDSNGNIGEQANVTVDKDTGVVTCLIKVNGDKALIDTYSLEISAGEGEPITIEKTKYKKTSGENSINIDMVQLVNELEVGSYTATLTLYDAEENSICNINKSFTVLSEASLAE